MCTRRAYNSVLFVADDVDDKMSRINHGNGVNDQRGGKGTRGDIIDRQSFLLKCQRAERGRWSDTD